MNIFTRRNALVGFVTLKALERRRKRQRRSTWKLAAFIVAGLLSAGILAGLALVVLRRQRDVAEESQGLQGYAVADEVTGEADGRGLTELDADEPAPGFTA